jgi:hypothetical protein
MKLIKLAYIQDPITKQPSVSLTNLVISLVFLLVAGGLDLAGKVKGTSIALEYFGVSAALYFSRRINVNGKSFTAEREENSNG